MAAIRGAVSRAAGATRSGSAGTALARYAAWLAQELDAEHITLVELAALEGKVLGCRCAPERCHGEVLERAADWAARMLAGGPNFFWDLRPSRRGGHFEPYIEGGSARRGSTDG